ncbi:MAG: hypothetical protein WD669_07250 [Pirellulales bacterium]
MKEFAFAEPPFDFAWFTNDQIHRKWRRDNRPNSKRLIDLIPTRHDHQDIYVAVRVRPAVGVRAE